MAQWLERLKPSADTSCNGGLLDTAEIADELSLDDRRGGCGGAAQVGGDRRMMATENLGAPSVEKRFENFKSEVGALFNPHRYGRTSRFGENGSLVDDANDKARLGATAGTEMPPLASEDAVHVRTPAEAPTPDVNLLSFDEPAAAPPSAPPPPSVWEQQQPVLMTQQQQQQALMMQYQQMQQMQWQQHMYLQHQYQQQQHAMMAPSRPAPASPGLAPVANTRGQA